MARTTKASNKACRKSATKAEDGKPGAVAPEISVDEAKRLLSDGKRIVLVDIRGEGERCLGHIAGARFIPPAHIEQEFGESSEAKDTCILVYCSSGSRSVRAVEKLRYMGFKNACSISSGYDGWLKAGLDVVNDTGFTPRQLDRYSRNMLLKEIGEEGQAKLMGARVLLVGAGGLGSSAGLYLAAAGVGTLGFVDFDTVDLSNLNRQILHGERDVGTPKAESALAAIERINSDIRVIPFQECLTADNAFKIMEGFDVVLDACDNTDTKFLLNDACYFLGKPYVFGGAVGFEGQAGVFWPKEGGPCLRCLFPKPPPTHLAPS